MLPEPPSTTTPWSDRARRVVLPLSLLGSAAIFLIVVHKHYPVQKWLFWHYATFWILCSIWAVACVAAGHVTITKILKRPLRPIEQVSVGFAVGVFEFFFAMFLLGLAQGIRPWLFPLVPAVMLAVGGGPLLRYARRWLRHVRHARPRAPPWNALHLAIVAFGFVGCAMIYFSILPPENAQFDARWKHLAMAEDMLAYGGVRRFPEGSTVSSNPHLPSFLYVWAFMLPGAQLWDKVGFAAHLEFTTLLGQLAALPALVRLLVPRSRGRFAWAARFLFPGVFLYDSSLSMGADHVAALFVLPMFILLLRTLPKLEPRLCVLLAMMIAGGIMAKLTSLLMLLPLPAAALVGRGLWLARPSVREGAAISKNAWIVGPLVTLAAGLVFTAPFWLKNWIWYGDPIYPSLHKYLHLRPWTQDAADLFEYGYKEHQFWRPSRDLAGLKKTLAALVNFSFVPNDYAAYHGKVPVFGSLFTLFLVALPFLKNTRRIWALVACVHASLFVWYWTHHQDRYLQTIVPWMAAVTAATLVKLWDRDVFTRLAASALVGVQIVWGGDVYFIPGHVMIKSPVRVATDLMSSGYQKNHESRFRIFTPWSDIGKALPKGANVLLHDNHSHLGINAISVSDWGGWQFGISYGRMGSPREIHDMLVKMGVTHMTWDAGKSQAWDSVAGDIMFFDFALKYALSPKSYGGITLAKMPKTPPPDEIEDTVAVIACPRDAYKTGLYHVKDLHVPVFGPRRKKYPKPTIRAGGEPEELVKEASYVVLSTKCKKTMPAAERSKFMRAPKRRKVGGEQEIWIRKTGSEPEAPAPSTTKAGADGSDPTDIDVELPD
jgi:hypothetical protein